MTERDKRESFDPGYLLWIREILHKLQTTPDDSDDWEISENLNAIWREQLRERKR